MKTKRFVIAIILMVIILTLCTVSTWDLARHLDDLGGALETLGSTPPDEQQRLVELCNDMQHRWDNAESHFVLYVSHDNLNLLTQMIAELPALAVHAEYSLLYSHIDAIEAMLKDLWQSSIPSYRTLL